jgi:putative redox protein
MSIKKITFTNSENQQLSARLELPNHEKPHSYAIFAHCFTCNKNLLAVKNIARALNNKGIAVLRFDFTGLGESEGDFVDTNFSSNIQDLISASDFLTKQYQAPSLLIGHSLGGAAVIYAAKEIESIKAVATIGAPSSPDHVQHLFKSDLEEIKEKGKATVSIGGREFSLKKEFLEDIESKKMESCIKSLRKPILIMHSPQDNTVGIQNAKELYHYAHHPKSFISIDGADHLLSNKEDSIYVGNIISGWASRYLEIPSKKSIKTSHQVAVSIGNDGYTSEVVSGKHFMIADEPESIGGNDFGPSPYEFVSAGLGACTAITLRMYADRKEWELEQVIVHVNHEKIDSEKENKKVDVFNRDIQFFGNLEEKQINRLLQIVDKCPIHKTLHNSSVIKTNLKK